MSYVNITREGEKILHKELKHLKEVKRPAAIKALQDARRKGDLSENAEYDAAKEEKNMVETRIHQIESMLRKARIIDGLEIADDRVYIGASVELEDLSTGKTVNYTLVNEIEADFKIGKISTKSPIGKALLGKAINDSVEINIPKGTLRYRVIKISR